MIDPLFTETAKLSTRHIAAYPGKDYAVLAWLVREIIDGGPLEAQQPVHGLDELRAALQGLDRPTAAEIAGVPEQDLEDLLAAIRRKGKVVVETGTGIACRPVRISRSGSPGCDDPHRRHEPQGWRVVPPRVSSPLRKRRAPVMDALDSGIEDPTRCHRHDR